MQAGALSDFGASSVELQKAADAERLFCLDLLDVSYDAKRS